MWYFTWILGLGAALAFGIINVMWLEASYTFGELDEEMNRYWNEWDLLIEREASRDQDAVPEHERRSIRDRMVDVLNRRSYVRNLVRDVNEVLE